MKSRPLSVAIILIISLLTLSACNLPAQQPQASSTTAPLPLSTPTPTPLCANPFFPDAKGDKWEYSGTNTIQGAYTRTDSITNTAPMTFTQESTTGGITYSVEYNCSSAGLTSTNPVQQYAGALLNSPNAPVKVKLSSNTGVSLPATIKPGDKWQQSADFEANSTQINVSGRFVFDYTAVGYENVTVPAGTYNALRVDGTIHVELTGLHIPAGTYTTTTWLVPQVGMVKSEGTSQVPGVDFTDSMQLNSFTPAP